MRQSNFSLWVLLFVFSAFAVSGCDGSSSNSRSDASDGTGSEVATAAIGGASTTSEGTIASRLESKRNSSYLARASHLLNPLPEALAVPSCDWSSVISACSSNDETLTFDGCSAPSDPAIRISGSLSLDWTGANCCTASPLSASSTVPCSFTRRTISSSGAADPLIRSVGSHSVTLDTEDSSGYAQAKSGGFSITCQGVSGNATCDGQREISISGAHYTGPSGRAQWDHTVSTDQPAIEQGHDGSRAVLSGVIRVQHNLTQMTSISTITSPLTFTSGCCYPTGGVLSTTFSDGKFAGKTETFTYGPGCGQVTFAATSQQQTGLTLHHCL